MPAGFVLVGRFPECVVHLRMPVEVEWAREAGDLFERNMVMLRCELRAAVTVMRGSAFARVDLTA